MVTIIKDEIVTAKDECQCILCKARISPKTNYRRVVFSCGSETKEDFFHIECANALVDYSRDLEVNTWTSTLIKDWVDRKLREKGIEPARTCRETILQYEKND